MPAWRGVGTAYPSARVEECVQLRVEECVQLRVEECVELRVEVGAVLQVVERDVTLKVREGWVAGRQIGV